MIDRIDAVNRSRNVARSELGSWVRKVAVIVCSPRSGSSLLKDVLAAHPNVASMDGEIEPYLILSRNGFGHNSDSDAIGFVTHRDALLDNIAADLTVPCAAGESPQQIKERWRRRLLLQFPTLCLELDGQHRLMSALDAAFAESDPALAGDPARWSRSVLERVFGKGAWRLAFYDGVKDVGTAVCFGQPEKIEEPPFVTPRLGRRAFEQNDANDTVLLFKTPPDAYRMGMYRQLFPLADIKYVHLTRGYAQAVNGLMDGWLSPTGFFSHDLNRIGMTLRIDGYSDVTPFGKRWWNFDLPPNWREFINAPLEEVCLNQWLSSHKAVLACSVPVLRIAFEDFLLAPDKILATLTDYLGLAPLDMPATLPLTMATAAPGPGRWRKRENLLTGLGERLEVRAMMARLGYPMNPEQWI